MFVFLLFVAAFAEKNYIKKIDDFRYYKIRTGDCNFVNANGTDHWFIVDRVNDKPMVTTYEKAECSGKSTSNKEIDAKFNAYIGNYEEEPQHIALYTVADKDNCPNDKYALKIFYRNLCGWYDDGTSKTYNVRDNKMYEETFKDKQCNNKNTTKEIFKCDSCVKDDKKGGSIKYVCGSVATMILSVFFVLAILF